MDQQDRVISAREQQLNRYFREIPTRPTNKVAFRNIGIGAVLVFLSLTMLIIGSPSCSKWVLVLVLVSASGALFFKGLNLYLKERYLYEKAMVDVFPQPSDREVDQWFHEEIYRLRRHSLEKLDLTDLPQEADLAPIVAPILWYVDGVLPVHLVQKKGQDGVPRFGVYQISFLYLLEDILVIFRCDFNFIRGAILNEESHRYYYQDIVSVSTKEEASSLTLPSGSSLTRATQFRISVANGSYFAMTIGADELKQLTGAEIIPDNGTAVATRVLNEKLRVVKGQLRGA